MLRIVLSIALLFAVLLVLRLAGFLLRAPRGRAPERPR
jgi:hypothetical protein